MTIRINSEWNFFDKLGGILIMLFIIALSLVHIGERIEGMIFPVVIEVELTGFTPDSDNPAQTIITAAGVKVRGECDYRRIEWFLGTAATNAEVFSVFRDPPEIRTEGKHTWESLIVNLPESLIKQSSFGIAVHRCHPLWETRTKFYTSEVVQ